MRFRLVVPGLLLAVLAPVPTFAQKTSRAIVADFVNSSSDRHASLIRFATDAVALELNRAGVYHVVAVQEVARVAKSRRMEPPYREEDIVAIAREIDVAALVTGEIHHVEIKNKSGHKEVEVGLIVRVRDIALGEVTNGAAERGVAVDPTGKASEISLLIDAANNAAARIALRLGAYQPIVGTIMNSSGRGAVVLNRGSGHGVRKNQEFVAIRDGRPIGRLRVTDTRPNYSELLPIDGAAGIRPEDKAVAVFPEPRFTK